MGDPGRGDRGERDHGRRDRLPDELRALGRDLPIPAVDAETMVERVLAGLVGERVPDAEEAQEPPGRGARLRSWARARWRSLTAALCGLLVVLALTPPVRAAVTDWFDFGGVGVRYDPSAAPPTDAGEAGTGPAGADGLRGGPPACRGGLGLEDAARRAGFRPLVPSGLGAPDAVELSADRRVLSLCWTPGERGSAAPADGVVRLDELRATIHPAFWKTTTVPFEPVEVGGRAGLWFAEPHRLEIRLTDAAGRARTETVRTAGPTLLWQTEGGLTLRLEGVRSRERALEVAESSRAPRS
ncbi:hypothetical protein [Streptomyces sp. 7N604]|uniref:hypothetical protein n=1 Tax=Streptomyces sp. 7N604 TaxID=3457415 RepID=UPI003FD224AB